MLGEILEFAVGAGLEAGRIKQLREAFIPPAVVIANSQGWVSFGRLSNQLGRKDAQLVLYGACQQGLLYQAVNGRFYPAPAASQQPPALFQPSPEEAALPPETRSLNRPSGSGSGFILIVATVLFVGATAITAFIASRPEPSVQVIPPAPAAAVPIAAIPSDPAPLAVAEPWQSAADALPAADPPAAVTPAHHKHRKHKAAAASAPIDLH